MKSNFFMTLICICFIATSSVSAQTVFKFRIWKNSAVPGNYLGEHTATLSGSGSSAYVRTSPLAGITSSLNPGDVLIIKNLCSQGGSQLHFDGITRRATIGFTSRSGCSTNPIGGIPNPNPLKHIAAVCQSLSCTTAPQHFGSWNWNTTIAVTLPAHASANTYLMISCGIMGTPVTNCSCGGHASFTKIENLASGGTGGSPILVSYAMQSQVYVQPNTGSQTGGILTVFDKATGRPVQTTPYRNGINFTYITDVEYEVVLRNQGFIHRQTLKVPKSCRGNNRNNVSNNTTTLSFEPTTLSTFPNPTTGIVNLQLKDAETAETSIKVLNSLGQIILEKQVQNDSNIQVDLSKETSGIYILHIVNGKTQFTENVIKE